MATDLVTVIDSTITLATAQDVILAAPGIARFTVRPSMLAAPLGVSIDDLCVPCVDSDADGICDFLCVDPNIPDTDGLANDPAK